MQTTTWCEKRAARVRELRTRCVTELSEFDRVTRDIHEPRINAARVRARHGYITYRVRLRGLKLRIIALHNSIRKCRYDGCAIPVWKLAERLRCSESQYRACMRELVEAGIFILAPYYVDKKMVNRHDVRHGHQVRVYSRSRRANVVVFGFRGLQLLGLRPGNGAGTSVELRSTPSPESGRNELSKFRVDKLRTWRREHTWQKPEGNDLENFENSLRQDSGEGVERSSTDVPAPDGASLSYAARYNCSRAAARAVLRAWLADKEE